MYEKKKLQMNVSAKWFVCACRDESTIDEESKNNPGKRKGNGKRCWPFYSFFKLKKERKKNNNTTNEMIEVNCLL